MKKTSVIYSIGVLAVGLFLSLFVLYTPLPNTDDELVFNTKLATEYIAAISQDQHSVYDPDNHEVVRLYLKDTLTEFLGASNVYEYNYDRSLIEDDIEYDIHNLLGVIEGKNDTGILLVGHYDSRGHIGRTGELGESYGAADDGYAIATMLEIARLYADKNLENSLYILMTDAEETGLYGAQMMATETTLMEKIGFVINIEARGVKGPAYMFETSTNNTKVIDFYTNAELPVTYSLATAVYTVMPNSTDFTEFLAIDKNGMNFAVLNGLEYYHTPFDNYTNINQSSIQHYGTQIVPLVDEFVMNDQYKDVDYFDAETNQVFFTLFANVFVHYGEGFATVMHIVCMLLAVLFTGYLFVKKELTARIFGFGAASVIGAMVVAYFVGSWVAKIVAFFSKVPFDMTYVRTLYGNVPSLLTLVGLTMLLGYLYMKKAQTFQKGIVVFGMLLNLLLALLTGFVLSGASFLFLIAGVTGLLVLAFEQWCVKIWVKRVVFALLMILNILVVVPIIFSLYLALTIGGLLALGIILVFYLVVLIPLFTAQLTSE